MRRYIKYFTLLIIIFIGLTLFSCQKIIQDTKLKDIENKYSEEFRQEIESIEDKEELNELINDQDELKAQFKRFSKLEGIERKYSSSLREAFEENKNVVYLDKILDDEEAVKLLNDVYEWESEWFYILIGAEYPINDLKFIINTVEGFRHNDEYRISYLNHLTNNSNSELSEYSIAEISNIFKRLFEMEFPNTDLEKLLEMVNLNGYKYTEFIEWIGICDDYTINFGEYLIKNDSKKFKDLFSNSQDLEIEYENFLLEKVNYDEFEGDDFQKNITNKILVDAFKRYPIGFIEKNLNAIYIGGLDTYEHAGVGLFANMKDKTIFLTVKWYQDELSDENLFYWQSIFHHEFSHILHYNYYNLFNEQEWLSVNPEDFQYLPGGSTQYWEEGYDMKWINLSNEKLHKDGFFNRYAMASIYEDFASITEQIFINPEWFWEYYEKYPKLAQKVDLTIDFYNAIDPTFSKEYFKSLPNEFIVD